MGNIRERLAVLLEERLEDVAVLRLNASHTESDRTGSASASLANSLRFIGVAQYVLNHDIGAFKTNLIESARIRLRLLDRFDTRAPISKSYVSILVYKSIFNALAAGDFSLGQALASKMGGRSVIEQEYDHPFDLAMGYALRACVLDNESEMEVRIGQLESYCAENSPNFVGYADLFKVIYSEANAYGSAALVRILEGHEREANGRGCFKDSEDEMISVWAVGTVNLARTRGLSIPAVAPLVPDDLLIRVQ